ncbi:MAG: hypothetical protein GY950_04950 [bacterium]|nr:hypothetical protein [bacterium]
MSDKKICYRKLKKYKYKYKTMEKRTFSTKIKPGEKIDTHFIVLATDGELTIREQYAWDGPSGPTIDTKNFMRGSLVHDALYQLLRGNYFEANHKEVRKKADQLLKDMCREDGMCSLRACYVYLAVRLFAKGAAKPTEEMFYAP